MKVKKLILLVTLGAVMLLVPGLQAQTLSLSLKECLDMTFQRNLQMSTAKNSVEIAELTYLTRKAAFLPNLGANATGFKNLGTTIDNFSQTIAQNPLQAQVGVNAGLTLFRGFANWNSLKSAQFSTIAAEYGVEDAENTLTLSVMQGFFTILFDAENIHLTENRIDVLEKQLERVKSQAEAGLATRGDIYNVESQLATERVNLVNQQNSLNRDKLSLSLLMNMERGKDFELEAPEMASYVPDGNLPEAGDVVDYARMNMPGIRQKELQIKAGEYNMKSARSGSMPTLGLGFGVGSFYSSASSNFIGFDTIDGVPSPVYAPGKPFFGQLGDNVSAQVSLSLNVPIFNNFTNRQTYLQAKVNLENSKLDLQRMQQDLYQRIMLATQDAQASLAKFEATQAQLVSQTEAYNYARQRYEAGLLDFFSYSQTLNNKTNTEVQLIQAKYDYIYKNKILDLYQGKDINF